MDKQILSPLFQHVVYDTYMICNTVEVCHGTISCEMSGDTIW